MAGVMGQGRACLEDKMGKKLDLTGFTEEEISNILNTLQGDFRIRKNEYLRVCDMENNVDSENQKASTLLNDIYFNDKNCIRCYATFGVIFNRKHVCIFCHLNVCKRCGTVGKLDNFICFFCSQKEEVTKQRGQWFYTRVQQRFRRYGSAKVAKALHRRYSPSSSFYSEPIARRTTTNPLYTLSATYMSVHVMVFAWFWSGLLFTCSWR